MAGLVLEMETRLFAVSVLVMIAALAPAGSADDSDPPAETCTDRLNVMALAHTVALHATACLTDSDVEEMAASSGNPTWLYEGTASTTCTILSWGGPNGTSWYAAPCFVNSRASDNASLQPCTSLRLTGKAWVDLCLPEPGDQPAAETLEPSATQGSNGTSANGTS